jgi:hypothetical protein
MSGFRRTLPPAPSQTELQRCCSGKRASVAASRVLVLLREGVVRLVAAGCGWLRLVAAGCGWLRLVAAGCGWLRLVAAGCGRCALACRSPGTARFGSRQRRHLHRLEPQARTNLSIRWPLAPLAAARSCCRRYEVPPGCIAQLSDPRNGDEGIEVTAMAANSQVEISAS